MRMVLWAHCGCTGAQPLEIAINAHSAKDFGVDLRQTP